MELLRTCAEEMPSLPYDLRELQPYAVDLRYDEGEPLSTEEREQMKQAKLMLNTHVLERILECEAASYS